MPALEDALKGNLVMLAVAGAATLVLPRLFPNLAPPMRSAVKAGLDLFLEAESEAEGGIVDRLVAATVQNLVKTLSAETTEQGRRHAAERAMAQFEHVARRRARRHGWNEADQRARYRRHVRHLHRALQVAQARVAPEQAAVLAQAGDRITEDW